MKSSKSNPSIHDYMEELIAAVRTWDLDNIKIVMESKEYPANEYFNQPLSSHSLNNEIIFPLVNGSNMQFPQPEDFNPQAILEYFAPKLREKALFEIETREESTMYSHTTYAITKCILWSLQNQTQSNIKDLLLPCVLEHPINTKEFMDSAFSDDYSRNLFNKLSSAEKAGLIANYIISVQGELVLLNKSLNRYVASDTDLTNFFKYILPTHQLINIISTLEKVDAEKLFSTFISEKSEAIVAIDAIPQLKTAFETKLGHSLISPEEKEKQAATRDFLNAYQEQITRYIEAINANKNLSSTQLTKGDLKLLTGVQDFITMIQQVNMFAGDKIKAFENANSGLQPIAERAKPKSFFSKSKSSELPSVADFLENTQEKLNTLDSGLKLELKGDFMPDSVINDRLSRLDEIQVKLLGCAPPQIQSFYEDLELLCNDIRYAIKRQINVNTSEEKISQLDQRALALHKNSIEDNNIDEDIKMIKRNLFKNQETGMALLNELHSIFTETNNETITRINKILGVTAESLTSIKQDQDANNHFNEFKNALETAIHDKVRKTNSLFTFRDKTLERQRNALWIALAKDLAEERYNDLDSALPSFAHAIESNYKLTNERFIEKHKKHPTEKQLDFGKIYEKTASKLHELSPEKFKQIIAKTAETLNLPKLDIFFKNLRSDGKPLTVDMVFSKEEQAAHKNSLINRSGFAWKPN